MFHWFYKGLSINTLCVSLKNILLTKKHLISTPYAWTYFSRSSFIYQKDSGGGGGWGVGGIDDDFFINNHTPSWRHHKTLELRHGYMGVTSGYT